MNKVKLIWATPSGQDLTAYIARVSNPSNQDNKETGAKLIKYLIEHDHWSPLEMIGACVEIETPRDIARQILRHRSFSFQEFSQRYAVATQFAVRECRMQDHKNRQNSIEVQDRELQAEWTQRQQRATEVALEAYNWALSNGIAKECARVVLPEGNTMSRMYMTGNLRSWFHYLKVRLDPSTQKEHRDVAEKIKVALSQPYPEVISLL